jgi:hypothetical protein
LVLLELLRDVPIPRVCSPHGADSGFDPHSAYEHDSLTLENVYGYSHGIILPYVPGKVDLVCPLNIKPCLQRSVVSICKYFKIAPYK